MPLDRYPPKAHILLFVLLGILLYWYTLPYPFVFDSRVYIIKNPLITDFDSFIKLFDIPDLADDYIELKIHRDVVVTFILRPFANFTFFLNYLSDSFDPEGYRAVNVAIHIVNAILWYTIMCRVIASREAGRSGGASFIPFFSSLLFLVHPLATESVTYIIQRYASLGAMLYLVTMLLFLLSLDAAGTTGRRLAYSGSVIALFVGMMTKENLMTAPFVLILMATGLRGLPLRDALRKVLPHLCCLPALPYVVYLISAVHLEGQQSLLGMHRVVDGYRPYEYVITEARAVLTYLRMIIAPYGQSIDPAYPLYRSILHPEIVISLLLILLFLVTGVTLLTRKKETAGNALLGFCILFSMISLSISSLFPLPDLMAEHRSYLFSLPVITGLVCRIDMIRSRLPNVWGTRIVVALCLLAGMYAVVTVRRNLVYSSRTSIWEDAVVKSPNKWRPNYNAGWAAVNEHHYEKARYYFTRSIEINPYEIRGYANLGSTQMLLGDYGAAIAAYRRGLMIMADEPVLLENLGKAYSEAGQHSAAVEAFEQAVSLRPVGFGSYGALAELYAIMGNIDTSCQVIQKARDVHSPDASLDSLEKELCR